MDKIDYPICCIWTVEDQIICCWVVCKDHIPGFVQYLVVEDVSSDKSSSKFYIGDIIISFSSILKDVIISTFFLLFKFFFYVENFFFFFFFLPIKVSLIVGFGISFLGAHLSKTFISPFIILPIMISEFSIAFRDNPNPTCICGLILLGESNKKKYERI